MKPIVATVGRPNVGKSMLFNKLTGRRVSIVEDVAGVTRDRVSADCEWAGKTFTLVDTGGLCRLAAGAGEDSIESNVRRQSVLAIEGADVVIFLLDIKTGLTAEDAEVADLLKKQGKPVVVAVNKHDSVGVTNPDIYEFYALGLGDPMPVSALHGHGIGDLLDTVCDMLDFSGADEEDDGFVGAAIIGKPNAGKSSLLNALLGEERAAVSGTAGTTRDATDTRFENEYGRFNFIDTAGIRRKSRVTDNVERYSVMRAVTAVERCDVCLITIDANDGVTEQDAKIAGLAHDSGKGCILVVNKWDLIDKDEKSMDKFRAALAEKLPFMSYAPSVFVSAKTGKRVANLFEMITRVQEQRTTRLTTGMLNNVLSDATARVQPPADKGRRLKLYYMTQTGVKPPEFIVFVNDVELFHFSYKRYIENQIRRVFGFEGTPVRITGRGKGEND